VNYRLPDDILIRHIEPVPDTFDAIASTISKTLSFFIWNTLDHSPFFFRTGVAPLAAAGCDGHARRRRRTWWARTISPPSPGPDIIANNGADDFRLLGVVPGPAHP